MNIKTRVKKILERGGRLAFPARALTRRAGGWWLRQHRRWGLVWRVGNALAAVLIMASILAPVLSQLSQSSRYKLTASTLSMVGLTDPTLTDQLTYNGQTQTYEFNKAAVQQTGDNPLAKLQAQVGTASGKDSNKSLYALDVPQNLSRGVAYHDVNSQLSFSLVPEFSAGQGQEEQGHIVFPLGGGTQAVYTLKNNGLKEDIVVPKATADSMTFSYKLNLPNTLEAKVIPNSDGSLGIYSADPTLFGNISYGSSSDQAAVEKARVSSPKTYLVFGLPAPVVKTAGGTASNASARFQLNGNELSVVASGLGSLNGPFSIDPSVVVSSASDFSTGNNEDNISFGASGGISRGGLTGGTVSGGWTATSNLPTNVANGSTAIYNGYIYMVGGRTATNGSGGASVATVQYTQIQSNGTLGAWQTTTPLPYTDNGVATVAYNGYLYAMGGFYGGSGGAVSNVDIYAPIHTDGTIGVWLPTTNLPTALVGLALTTYNGYAYIAGGGNPSSGSCNANPTYCTAAVYYAPFNADGTIGTWQTATSLPFARDNAVAVADNGYLYILEGEQSGVGFTNEVDFAPIKADGTIGTWQATSSFTAARYGGGVAIYNGYMYLMGGWGSGGSPFLKDTQYAQINANGTLGTWQYTASSNKDRNYANTIAYNGYMYLIGGWDDTKTTSTLDVEYAKIDPTGVTGNYATASNAMSTSIYDSTSVAYDGYLYLLGGSTTYSLSSITNNVYYAPLNSDGSVGTWATTSTFTQARNGAAAVAYNGYMYLIGGWHNTADTNCAAAANQACGDVQMAAINANGTLGTWSSAGGNFSSQPRSNLGAAVYNGYLYVFGGVYNNNSSLSSETDVGQISSTGTIASWTTTGSLTRGRSDFGVAQAGSYLYALGGRINGTGATNYSNTIDYAVLGNSGSVTWTSASNLFTNGRSDLDAGANNGYVYISAGAYGAGNNVYSDTQYARICMGVSTADGCSGAVGTLGTWHTTSSFTTGRTGQMGTIYNGYLYVIGGCSNQGIAGNCAAAGNTLKDVQYAPINNGGSGTAGTWITNANSFTNVRNGMATVVYNGYLYIMGGNNNGTYYNDVQYAPINADGTIGTWKYTYNSASSASFVGGFTTARQLLSGIAYNGYMYVMGGYAGTNEIGDVQYAPINADGTIGTWNTTTSLPTVRDRFGVVTHNGYMYVMGGALNANNYLNDVQYAPIHNDGTLGSWTATNSFTTARDGFGSVIYNGYLYLLGGYNFNYGYFNDVQYAPINADGTIGTWNTTTSLPIARYSFGTVVYNGYLYIVGGSSKTGYKNDVQYAPINADGTLGNWKGTGTFANGRYRLESVIYNGFIYLTGGSAGSSTYYNDTQYAPLNNIDRVGHYSKLIDLGSTMNITGVTYSSTTNSAVNVTYRAAGSNGQFGTSGQVGTISGIGGCVGNTQNTRYLFVSVTLNDSYGQGTSGAFPDSVGTPATLTSLTVNYNPVHPPPNIRLRLGQTLQQGNLSPFDTCVGVAAAPSKLAPVVASIGAAGTGYGGSGIANVGVPSGVTSGSLVIAYVWGSFSSSMPTTATITPPSGSGTWNVGGSIITGLACEGNSAYCMGIWYYKYATGNDTGVYSFNSGGNADGIDGYALRITGGATSGNPFSDTFQSGSGASGTVTIPSFTPGGNGSLLLAGMGQPIFQNTFTAPGGWAFNAQYSTNQYWGIGVANVSQTTAASTGALTFKSSSTSDAVIALIATLRSP